MSAGETLYLIGAVCAFALFAAVLAWVDVSTKDVRDGR